MIDVIMFKMVHGKRSQIFKLVSYAKEEAKLRHKRIERIDPLIRYAKNLFPYYSDEKIHQICSVALRIILFEDKIRKIDIHQTTLTSNIEFGV
ncbi:hypothetical protein KEJ21_03360 [Candidatus Bathyarchaeota archaeon]|nr:hypothetical protein [Candidatus Bathyarchaeota archaeon]MBS7630277.1 hypothetical protein [Candidatus Bathyarchaeota archaeon]